MTNGGARLGAVVGAGMLSAALVVASAPAATDTPVSPIAVSMVPQKQVTPVRGSDGRYHVMYEFGLTNASSDVQTLESVQVLNAANGRRIETLTAADILAGTMLRHPDRVPIGAEAIEENEPVEPLDSTTFPANGAAILFINLTFDKRRQIPDAINHRFTVNGVSPFSGLASQFRYRAGAVEVSQARAPVVTPPVDGKGWLVSDGCCTPLGHVTAMYGINGKLQAAERFAADYIQIGPAGTVFSGERSDPRNWFGYGAKVRSMTAGVVSKAVDNLPDQVPGQFPSGLPFAKFPGNQVVVADKRGFSSVYAHLVPGSVRVQAGDRVRAGQVIGRLGNTGASAAPHLHFHVVNGRAAARSDGYPFEFGSFKLAGQGIRDQLGASLTGAAAFPSRAELDPVRHRRELPLDFNIVDFPN